ncbi:unnamed protein product [Caenorhabditis sp. 36 PRJEB53466]|nr:unnamed protein product [Caenorhabditis sp. 36 PRJEB53466]
MQALLDQLRQINDTVGYGTWDLLLASHEDLKHEVVYLRKLEQEKEEKAQETIKSLQNAKKELTSIKNQVNSLKIDYADHIESVKSQLAANGLEMNKVVQVFEKVLADALSTQKSQILAEIQSNGTKRSFGELENAVRHVLAVLEQQKGTQLRSMIAAELDEFYAEAVQVFRLELWNLMQSMELPMKKPAKNASLHENLQKICQFSCDLDVVHTGNSSESIANLISAAFGQLVNLCVDMVENEKGDADFEWILKCADEWAVNLRDVLAETIGELNVDGKERVSGVFDATFVKFVHTITETFLTKNVKNPLLFSNVCSLLRCFESTSSFDLLDADLFEPLYSSHFLSRWICFEVEFFTYSASKLLQNPACFRPLPALSIGSAPSNIWASEVTLFFEEWLSRVDKDVSVLGNLEAQKTFYETLHILMLDLRSRIRGIAGNLYSGASWSNDVYLVMNTIWELRRIVENLTLAWPISSFEIEKAYEKEWKRLGSLISEYLNDIVDSMDNEVRARYIPPAEKNRLISETFDHIHKCLHNASFKASKPSRSPLINILVEELFKNLQVRFDRWKDLCSVDVLSNFYAQIYSILLPHLDQLQNSTAWTRGDAARTEICNLDVLMKMAANRDPSGELVRTAFRSIDEEQVLKMLGELGIHASSDHAFQDYQILAENWNTIRDRGYGYGN